METDPPVNESRGITIRDSTLREGLDVPGVDFSPRQRSRIAERLDRANVPEIEVVAPGRVFEDARFARKLKDLGLRIRTSGLVYAFRKGCRKEVDELCASLDRFDLLMPVSEKRRPPDRDTKKRLLLDLLDYSLERGSEVGVGFPHSTQADAGFLLDIGRESVSRGAQRVVLYDTNGSSDPFAVYDLIKGLKEDLHAPLFFHAHNDLGLATANSLAAAYAGADGLDATVNGLGDRAGNAALEQVVMALHLKGFQTGISLDALKGLSEAVEQESGIAVPGLAPVVGEYAATHKSPGHLEIPELFEAFDPSLVGLTRKIDE